MALEIYSSYVPDPTVALTINSAGTGLIQAAYRYRLANGQVTALSPLQINLDYPISATIGTLYASQFDDQIEEYEFLFSNDSGATWRKQDRNSGQWKSPDITQLAHPTSAPVSITRTIAPGGTLALGTITAGQDQELPFYVVNNAGTENYTDLTFRVLESGVPSTTLSEKLTFALDNVGKPDGSVIAASGQTIWAASPGFDTFISVTIAPNDSAILRVIGSVGGGLLSQSAVNAVLEVDTNKTLLALMLPVSVPALVFAPNFNATWPNVTGQGSGNITVKRQFVNVGLGLVAANRADYTANLADGTYRLYANINGRITTQLTSETLPNNATEICTFVMSAGALGTFTPTIGIGNTMTHEAAANGALALGRWVQYNSSGYVEYQTSSNQDSYGITAQSAAAQGDIIDVTPQGLCLAQAGGTIAVGDLIGPSTDGKSTTQTANKAVAVAQSAATLDEYLLATVF